MFKVVCKRRDFHCDANIEIVKHRLKISASDVDLDYNAQVSKFTSNNSYKNSLTACLDLVPG